MQTAVLLFMLSRGATLMAQTPARELTPIDSALANRVAGCYELVPGGWQTDSEIAKIATIPRGPIRFELTNRPASAWAALSAYEHVMYFETHADSIAAWGTGLFTTWIRVSAATDTILVSRPLPMAGFALRLGRRGTDLVGTITAFTDAIPPNGKAEAVHAVTARRIACSPRR